MPSTVTASSRTEIALPVSYVEPGALLTELYVRLDGWAPLDSIRQMVEQQGARLSLAYLYQIPQSESLLGMLIMNVAAADNAGEALTGDLATIPGLQILSIQEREAGLAMAEQQTPSLPGTPAVIFGRAIIGSVTEGIVKAQGSQGEHLLYQLGHHAGELAASGLPPLLQELGLSITADLLARRLTDFQVMGWAVLQSGTVGDQHQGEVTLVDTFESAPWKGGALSPTCHFLRGFIAGVFSTAWDQPIDCQETACQAAGAPACEFVFQPAQH